MSGYVMYRANEETTHFVNWALRSGQIALPQAIEEMKQEAGSEVAGATLGPGLDQETLLATVVEGKLAVLLELHLEEGAEKACPNFDCGGRNHGTRWRFMRDWDGVGNRAWPFPNRSDYYEGSGPFHLISPLLASALERIDMRVAAHLILEHVSPEDAIPTCPSRFQLGFKWAKSEATAAQQARLVKLAHDVTGTDWDNWFLYDRGNAYNAAERLFFILEPSQDGDREAAEEFWGHMPEDSDVQWFAEGALEYLDQMHPSKRQR